MTKNKWQKMSLAQQMGNIGSEITRAFFWKGKNTEIAQRSAEKALELFDLTAEDKRWRFKLREILRLRSLFCDCFFELAHFDVSPEAIKRYFYPFALLANKNENRGFKR